MNISEMTRLEILHQALPLHTQRIAEETYRQNEFMLDWLNRHAINEDIGDILCSAFIWKKTKEGHNYWRALAEGT